MDEMFDRLVSLRVHDAMTPDPIAVNESDSMEQVANLFAAGNRHAAPVVDVRGCCVGMVTSSDFVRRCEEMTSDEGIHHELIRQTDGLHLVPRSFDYVAECMSPCVQSVSPATPLVAAARVMVDGHLHVLPVIEANRPVGMLSNLDVVAALINAYDEAKQAI